MRGHWGLELLWGNWDFCWIFKESISDGWRGDKTASISKGKDAGNA